ncbi:MAG: ABC transporter ATP-binding protein [Actinobacteria bacterium]|nr:ABC transporter ATP-binding protein [Actinomycetota bacterium]
MAPDTTLAAEEIAYSYGDIQAVDHISFHINRGEVLGFLGPNGAGKTTTLKMLIGLLEPQAGSITILGEDMVKNREKVQAQIGVCFEEKSLYEDMSAAANLKFFASLFGIKDLDAAGLLERVGLPEDRKDRVANYSKGMKQRLMVARALVNKPQVLFLDEPTDGLDPVSSEAIRTVVTEEKARGATVFLTTHDMMEADKLSDHVAFINEGEIAALDTPENLKHQYGKRVLKMRYHKDGELAQEEFSLDDRQAGSHIQEIIAGYEVLDMHTEEATLEDIFIQLTGKKLK